MAEAGIGRVIDNKYEIIAAIGKGGMSNVWLGRDRRLDKLWAIKEIKPSAKGRQAQANRQAIIDEANFMKRLDHPAIPRVVDIIDTGVSIFVVMDYVNGSSLSKVQRQQGEPFSQEEVIDWGIQLCDVLEYLHGLNPPVIYRDMKPKELLHCVSDTVVDIVPALAIVCSASLFGWVLQFEHIGQKMLNAILGITDNKWVVLLIIDILLLFMGMILDSTPTIMMMIPIFQPLVQQVGISEIHLGVVCVLNLMIGLMTPPYGQSLFMLSGATKTPFNRVVKYITPWLIPMFIALVLVTFFPWICLSIPRLFGMGV